MNLKEFIKKSQHNVSFTDDVPEYDTLVNLCSISPVSVFEIQDTNSGQRMTIAYYSLHGGINIFQDGDSAASRHLFFWFLQINHDDDPKRAVIAMFGDNWIVL